MHIDSQVEGSKARVLESKGGNIEVDCRRSEVAMTPLCIPFICSPCLQAPRLRRVTPTRSRKPRGHSQPHVSAPSVRPAQNTETTVGGDVEEHIGTADNASVKSANHMALEPRVFQTAAMLTTVVLIM